MDRDEPELAATVASADTPTVANDTSADSAPGLDSWPSATGAAAPVGSSLARYRLESVIGRGGMGEVVSARDEQIGRSVAIKRLKVASPTADATARFLREARIQGRLEHPAIVPVHEMWRDERGQPFFVMKKLSGTTLADVLASTDPEVARRFPRQRLLRAFAEICLAIEFAHTRGVVHRDLKPANIMLGEFGEVHVLDWGIARVLGEEPGDAGPRSFDDVGTLDGGSATVAGAILGTPGYMSAEQIRGDADLDGRADVYALGCILYEILAREPLYPRGQPGLAHALAGIDARPSVRRTERDIAPELDAACVAATMLDRRDRLASARELGDLVQRFLDGDRDLELRRDLARSELAAARAALERGTGDGERRQAMLAAARAIALDPHAREPAELLGRLMLQPPAQVPDEVMAELKEIEDGQLRAQARLGIKAMFAYLCFFPVMYVTGFRSPWLFVGGPLLVLAIIGTAWALARKVSPVRVVLSVGLNAVLVALFSRILTPFLIAPSLGVITAMVFAMHPGSGHAGWLFGALLAAILGPWLLELVGALSATTFVEGDRLVFATTADHLQPTMTFVGLALYAAVILGMAIALSRALALNRRAVQLMVQVQAWQMRQLVPATTATEPA